MTSYIDDLLRQTASLRHDNPENADIWAACDAAEELLWRAKYKGGISPSTVYRAIDVLNTTIKAIDPSLSPVYRASRDNGDNAHQKPLQQRGK